MKMGRIERREIKRIGSERENGNVMRKQEMKGKVYLTLKAQVHVPLSDVGCYQNTNSDFLRESSASFTNSSNT